MSDVLCFGNLQLDVLCRTVTALPPPEAESAAELLLRAFALDPGVEYMIPNPKRQPRIMRGMLLASVRYGLRWGEVHTVAGKGIAIWVPPPGKAAVTYLRLVRAGMMGSVLRCGPGELLRSLNPGLRGPNGLTAGFSALPRICHRVEAVLQPGWSTVGSVRAAPRSPNRRSPR